MKSRLILGIAAALLMSAPVAFAQDAGGTTGGACKSDIETLCKDAGDGRAKFKCLNDNEAKVSATCKTAMDARKAAREAVKTACKADRESLCKDAGDERGAGMKCLRDNASKVSADCSKALSDIPSRKG
jgi:hypothetical protein